MSDVFLPEAGLDQEYKKLSTALEIGKRLHQPGVVAFLKGPDGFDIPLPESVFNILVKVVDAMQTGQGVSVMPLAAKLTTQDAANFLGISRPTFIKLASTYEVALELVGRHRRVTLHDVMKMQQRMQSQRDQALDELIEFNNREGLYNHDKELLPKPQ